MHSQMAKIVAIIVGMYVVDLFPVDSSCYYSNSSTFFSRISCRRRKVRIVETIEGLLGVCVSPNPTRFVKHPDNLGDFVVAYHYRKNQRIPILFTRRFILHHYQLLSIFRR